MGIRPNWGRWINWVPELWDGHIGSPTKLACFRSLKSQWISLLALSNLSLFNKALHLQRENFVPSCPGCCRGSLRRCTGALGGWLVVLSALLSLCPGTLGKPLLIVRAAVSEKVVDSYWEGALSLLQRGRKQPGVKSGNYGFFGIAWLFISSCKQFWWNGVDSLLG